MPLPAGTKLGPYEILAPIGAGGMGEVYRARDTRLGRDVAIKISAQRFSERFEREARAIAALNHPNICTLHDIGPNYLVMEFVEGEAPKGPMPLKEALGIARQIAEALGEAHEKGITHRDLKPANIKIKADGSVKILDFGLAKMAQASAGQSEHSATRSMTVTEAGEILGTAAYMSPEQARGKPVNQRADIWAFGVVLYEILTGERPFQGKDGPQTMAAVILQEPNLEPVAAAVRPLLRRCLEKDPQKRLRDIGAVEVLLEECDSGRHRAGHGAKGIFPWATAGVLGAALAGLAVVHFRERPAERPVLRYTLTGPDGARNVEQFAVSPDGHYLVMRAMGDAGSQLWVRSLDSLQAQPLPGTENASYPFWSPDSRAIAFFSDNKLKKIAVNGGPAQPLCDAPAAPRGGAWSPGGVILTGSGFSGIQRVAETGGAPTAAARQGVGENRNPVFLPDGRHFLYVSTGGNQNGIFLASLDSGETRRLLPDESAPQYFNGHILLVRAGMLMAQPMDPKTFQTKGDLFPVAPDQILAGVNPTDFSYSVSASGVLVYQGGGAAGGRRHTWFDRTGKKMGSAGGLMRSRNAIALSPDGKKLAIEIERFAGQGVHSDLWTIDMEHSNTASRFTFDGSINLRPVWSPDSGRVAFGSNRQSIFKIFVRAYGGGQDELLFDSKEPAEPTDWSRDGKFIIFRSFSDQTLDDLWALPLTGDKKPVALVKTPYRETEGQLSPDGRWLAYASNESGGRFQVLVQPFAPAFDRPVTGKQQISTTGGMQPRWRADGRELFYLTQDRKLMAADMVETVTSLDHGTPRELFDWRGENASVTDFSYAVSPDGERFLIATGPGALTQTLPLTVVVNWLAAGKK